MKETLDLTNGTLKLQPQRSDAAAQLTARSIKIALMLDPAAVAEALTPYAPAVNRVPLTIGVEGRHLRTDFAPKVVRKTLAAIAAHGPDGVTVLIQGRLLPGDVIGDAGLVAQVKAPKPPPAA